VHVDTKKIISVAI